MGKTRPTRRRMGQAQWQIRTVSGGDGRRHLEFLHYDRLLARLDKRARVAEPIKDAVEQLAALPPPEWQRARPRRK